ncbi:hypothetical protein V6Z11_D08G050800 [Gossypium hirsutum]
MVQKKYFTETYDHCKIKGHKRESCYRIIGYLADFKFTKKKATNVSGSVVNNVYVNDPVSGNEMTSDVGLSSLQAPVFTQAQYQQILSLLNNEAIVKVAASLAGMVGVGQN